MAKALPSLRGRRKGTLRRALRRKFSNLRRRLTSGKSSSRDGGVATAAAKQSSLISAAVEQQNIQTGLLQQIESSMGRTPAAARREQQPHAQRQGGGLSSRKKLAIAGAAGLAAGAAVGALAARAGRKPQERVEGAPVTYDLDQIKFEADKIIFKGLSLPAAAQATPSQTSATPDQATSQQLASPSAGSRSSVVSQAFGAPTRSPIATQMAERAAAPQAATPGAPGATPAPPVGEGVGRVLATIRRQESGNNYSARAGGSSASGAYQFIDSTWRSLTRKYNIGTEYGSAGSAPPAIQDAVAGKYVEEILRQNNNDVSKVPLVWYTGNPQGRMSEAALRANRGQTGEMYQRKWMAAYGGGQAPAATQVANAPAQASALAQASTQRVVADGEQARNNQRIVQAMAAAPAPTERPPTNNQSPESRQAAASGDVSLRNRLLNAFNQLSAQAS